MKSVFFFFTPDGPRAEILRMPPARSINSVILVLLVVVTCLLLLNLNHQHLGDGNGGARLDSKRRSSTFGIQSCINRGWAGKALTSRVRHLCCETAQQRRRCPRFARACGDVGVGFGRPATAIATAATTAGSTGRDRSCTTA